MDENEVRETLIDLRRVFGAEGVTAALNQGMVDFSHRGELDRYLECQMALALVEKLPVPS
jgi:hypothetical protein